MSARGIPVQDLPENQDASVKFMHDQVLGTVSPIEDEKKPTKAEKKSEAKPAPPKKEVSSDPAKGEGK